MTAAHNDNVMSSNEARSYEFLGAMRPHVAAMPEDQERIYETVRIIPEEVKSILDAGCGDGRVMSLLRPKHYAIGIDYALSSVRNITNSGVQGSVGALPFRDQAFDMVMSCEVLEHLREGLFETTLAELKRVARQYILVSVPYKENLRRLLTRCDVCGEIFHIWGHVRSFTASALDHHFSPFTPVAARYVGRRPPYFSPLVLWCNQVLGNRWVQFGPTTMCSRCGNTAAKPSASNAITRVCGAINLLTNKCIPVRQRNWIIKLYRR